MVELSLYFASLAVFEISTGTPVCLSWVIGNRYGIVRRVHLSAVCARVFVYLCIYICFCARVHDYCSPVGTEQETPELISSEAKRYSFRPLCCIFSHLCGSLPDRHLPLSRRRRLWNHLSGQHYQLVLAFSTSV